MKFLFLLALFFVASADPEPSADADADAYFGYGYRGYGGYHPRVVVSTRHISPASPQTYPNPRAVADHAVAGYNQLASAATNNIGPASKPTYLDNYTFAGHPCPFRHLWKRQICPSLSAAALLKMAQGIHVPLSFNGVATSGACPNRHLWKDICPTL